MALSTAALSALIKSKRLAALGEAAVDNDAMAADCNAIAEAVIEHFMAAAVVTTPLGVAVQVAVPAGTGATIAPGIGSVG